MVGWSSLPCSLARESARFRVCNQGINTRGHTFPVPTNPVLNNTEAQGTVVPNKQNNAKGEIFGHCYGIVGFFFLFCVSAP